MICQFTWLYEWRDSFECIKSVTSFVKIFSSVKFKIFYFISSNIFLLYKATVATAHCLFVFLFFIVTHLIVVRLSILNHGSALTLIEVGEQQFLGFGHNCVCVKRAYLLDVFFAGLLYSRDILPLFNKNIGYSPIPGRSCKCQWLMFI